jgi:hypothetical protein
VRCFVFFEISPPFRWKPKYENSGPLRRLIWLWFSVGLIKTLNFTDLIKGFMNAGREEERNKWSSPVDPSAIPGVPVGAHPGAFGAVRKHDRHCGVDLYCKTNTVVRAVEDGVVVSIEPFTGSGANCPWWLNTWAVKIEGNSGVVCYGEIEPWTSLKIGEPVLRGDPIGTVIPVLKPEKLRKDIPGHSCSMLHMQIYKHGTLHNPNDIGPTNEMPDDMIDPTPYLLNAGLKELKG